MICNNMVKRCWLFGAGERIEGSNSGWGISDTDLIIAVDGGYEWLAELGVVPDILVGDFDSMDKPKSLAPKTKMIALPTEKDDTDMAVAVSEGLASGCTEFHIYGGGGGRTEHLFANVALLAMLAEQKCRGYLHHRDEVMTAIRNEKVSFTADSGGYVSAFALERECRGVFEKGLKFPLTDYTMRYDRPIGVSNEFVGIKSEISVADGTLLLIFTTQAEIEKEWTDWY